jgi:hypothetical protein
MYVATEKAKRELHRLEEAQGNELNREIANNMKSGSENSSAKEIDINFWAPHFMEGRLAKIACTQESFFSDLTAEGINKLDASLTDSERDAAREWIESMVVHNMDMCITLGDLFGGLQDVPKLLDFAVQAAKEEAQTRRELTDANS